MQISRRSVLVGAGAVTLAPLFSQGRIARGRTGFRFVHMTDIHVQPELHAGEGLALCVKKILELEPRPRFIISGGDHVMDLLNCKLERADVQFGVLKEALKPLEMPIHHAIGNHDVYGWSHTSPITVDDPLYGKNMFQERLSEKERSYRFTHGHWHFIVLDTISPAGRDWIGRVDDSQLQWLKDELAKIQKGQPIVLTVHVPIITAYVQFNEGTSFPSPNKLVTENGKSVLDLFKGHNLKLVLQGHTHVIEEVDYAGTKFFTAGSVCGEWWKGPRLGIHPEGFTVVDVEDDNIRVKYQPYGWHADRQRQVSLKI